MGSYKKDVAQKYKFWVWISDAQAYWPFLFWGLGQRYKYRGLQTIQMKLILLCVWAEPAVWGSAKTTLKFKREI